MNTDSIAIGFLDTDAGARAAMNRVKWKHGFSSCPMCQARLMYYLEEGHTLGEVMKVLAKNHPEIKNIRRYAMNAIRQTTGYGIFDDYIVMHRERLWTPRNPILSNREERKELKSTWLKKANDGRRITTARKWIAESKKTEEGRDGIHLLEDGWERQRQRRKSYGQALEYRPLKIADFLMGT